MVFEWFPTISMFNIHLQHQLMNHQHLGTCSIDCFWLVVSFQPILMFIPGDVPATNHQPEEVVGSLSSCSGMRRNLWVEGTVHHLSLVEPAHISLVVPTEESTWETARTFGAHGEAMGRTSVKVASKRFSSGSWCSSSSPPVEHQFRNSWIMFDPFPRQVLFFIISAMVFKNYMVFHCFFR